MCQWNHLILAIKRTKDRLCRTTSPVNFMPVTTNTPRFLKGGGAFKLSILFPEKTALPD